MFHIGFTPNTYPANALSAKHETLMGAIAQLFADLGLAYGPEEWFVARILEATKEAIDNLEDGSKPACGSWSDMGSEDDAFSINVFVDDSEAIYIKHNGHELLAPHNAVGFVLDEHNDRRWIYNDYEIAEWDNVIVLSHVTVGIEIACKQKHLVDCDDDGTERYAEIGMKGVAKLNMHGGDKWSVVWANDACGFYSEFELIQDTNYVGT